MVFPACTNRAPRGPTRGSIPASSVSRLYQPGSAWPNSRQYLRFN